MFKDLIIDTMLNTNELNRLQRCAKNKDKKEIIKWAEDFETRLSDKYRKLYKEYYNEVYKEYYMEQYKKRYMEVNIALLYTLHFGESTKFGNKRLENILKDFTETMREFYDNSFTVEDYTRMLIDDGIKIKEANK